MTQVIPSCRTLFVVAATLLSVCISATAQTSEKEKARSAKISADLLRVVENNGNLRPNNGFQRANLFVTEGNRVAIDAFANSEGEGQALLQSLQALGLAKGRVSKHHVYGYLPADRLSELNTIGPLRFARPAYKPRHSAGSVNSQGDASLRTNVARTTYGVNGTGIKVGVLSDSYDKLGGAALGVASGDLPTGVQVLKDYPGSAADVIDEGRGMMELVYDLAPNVALAFHTAFDGNLDFAQGILDLAAAGCQVIVDDVSYFDEPYFQDGVIAQAVDQVVNSGVTYFSSAANNGRDSYQSAYSEVAFAGPFSDPYLGAHNFGGGDVAQSVTIPPQSEIYIGLQWDNPFFSVSGGAGAETDLDLLVYKNGVFQPFSSGLDFNVERDAVEIAVLSNPTNAPATFELVIGRFTGPAPSLVKWIAFTNGYTITTEHDTKSSTIVGQSNSSRCISTGAAYYRDTPAFNNGLTTANLEYYSSAGGTPILFDLNGTRLTSPITRQKPEITSVDGTNTTFFGFDAEGDGKPNFFGTSASAPHAAAVAALMKQKVPSITPAAILSALKSTALDMDDPSTPGFDAGFDFGTGFGFIQADRALEVITETPPTSGVFSITGVTTVSCTIVSPGRRALMFTPTYGGTNSDPISFSVVNELLPTTASGPYSLTLYTDNPVIILSAAQTGVQSTFNYNWLGACGSNPTPPPSVGFAIVGATLFSCNPAGPNSRAISFSPQYSGTNGQPISFSVANEMMPTTASGPYSLTLYTDNPVITLKAIQQGTPDQGSYSFNWLAACGSQTSGARIGAELNLSVRVLGNPVAGEMAEIEISGAAGGPVGLNLVNTQGRVLHKHTISEAASVERVRIPLSGSKELLMLNVSTPTERKSIKLIKQ
ncbi:S8 family serine peptidase [Spirosoma sp. BT702]|uniref:S8 family serine peptidase n=1 Tax=Spirosoma profusum TaxID=2771354 RepID=A0A927AMP1_9BACT|nr:S8 family serine peptidase [Spirosoma profusum]MBD2700199.1 S8 family serine peptidase [Spirosoma profusum]